MFDIYVSDNWDEKISELLESFEEDSEKKTNDGSFGGCFHRSSSKR